MRSGEWILVHGFLMLDCYMVVALGAILQQKAESTIPIPTFSPPEGNTTFIEGTTWCVARPGASQFDLQNALDWACGLGAADCSLVQPGASCYEPDTLLGHASYAFNSYYQQNGNSDIACYFGGTAIITNIDPSKTPQSQVLKVFYSNKLSKLWSLQVSQFRASFCFISVPEDLHLEDFGNPSPYMFKH
ncbi:unnamed protein product [Musa textilis]